MNINVCTDFELLKVEVPLIFLGPVCFSTHSDGRYRLSDTFIKMLTSFPAVALFDVLSPVINTF